MRPQIRLEGLPANDEAVYWRLSELEGMRFMRALFRRFTFSPHTHDEYCLAVIERGVQGFRCAGTEHVSVPSSIVMIPPGELHDGRPRTDTGYLYRVLYVEPTLLAECAGLAPESLLGFSSTVVSDERLARRLLALHHAMDGPTNAVERHALAEELLLALNDLALRYARPWPAQRRGREDARVRRVVDILRSSGAQTPTLEELAELAGLSRFHFLRVFRAAVGMTPHAFLRDQRMLRARGLIERGARPAEVAARIGFCDQSHFTHAFRRSFCTTPRQYQRAFLGS